jgi:hypothetical protein
MRDDQGDAWYRQPPAIASDDAPLIGRPDGASNLNVARTILLDVGAIAPAYTTLRSNFSLVPKQRLLRRLRSLSIYPEPGRTPHLSVPMEYVMILVYSPYGRAIHRHGDQFAWNLNKLLTIEVENVSDVVQPPWIVGVRKDLRKFSGNLLESPRSGIKPKNVRVGVDAPCLAAARRRDLCR